MKLITINPNNEPYYSEDFIKGFKCGAERQFEADKVDIPIWIPCSERMPKESGIYLVSGVWESGKVAVDTCEYIVGDGYFSAVWTFDVKAWKPLPEPWKGADDE